MMKRMTSRKAIPLFDDRALAGTADGELRARLREFAQAVARRHRRSKAGLAEFVPALRGYYRTLAICSDVALPPARRVARRVRDACVFGGARERSHRRGVNR